MSRHLYYPECRGPRRSRLVPFRLTGRRGASDPCSRLNRGERARPTSTGGDGRRPEARVPAARTRPPRSGPLPADSVLAWSQWFVASVRRRSSTLSFVLDGGPACAVIEFLDKSRGGRRTGARRGPCAPGVWRCVRCDGTPYRIAGTDRCGPVRPLLAAIFSGHWFSSPQGSSSKAGC